MSKPFALILTIAIVATGLLGIWWLFWHLWAFVMPQVWPAGPSALIHPGYWLFCAEWTLFVLLCRVLRGKTGGAQ